MKVSLDSNKLKSLTVIEIIVTLIIIGILATLAIVSYGPSREALFDREAEENLRLIQTAEKLYHAKFTSIFYPDVGNQTDETIINSFLRLDLPTQNKRWEYQVTHTGCVSATRSGAVPRIWRMFINDQDPTSGAACP